MNTFQEDAWGGNCSGDNIFQDGVLGGDAFQRPPNNEHNVNTFTRNDIVENDSVPDSHHHHKHKHKHGEGHHRHKHKHKEKEFPEFNLQYSPSSRRHREPNPTSDFAGGIYSEEPSQTLSGVIAHCEAMMAADRGVSQQLRREVDDLDIELRNSLDTNRQLGEQILQGQHQMEGLMAQQQQLEEELHHAKGQLRRFHADIRGANVQRTAMRRSRSHLAEELEYLKQMVEEEERSLEKYNQANSFLEKSCRDLKAHATMFEWQKDQLRQDFHKEREELARLNSFRVRSMNQ